MKYFNVTFCKKYSLFSTTATYMQLNLKDDFPTILYYVLPTLKSGQMNLLKLLSNPVSIYFLEVIEIPEDQCVKSV